MLFFRFSPTKLSPPISSCHPAIPPTYPRFVLSCVKSAITPLVGIVPPNPPREKNSVPPSTIPSGEVATKTLAPFVDTPEIFRSLLSFSVQTMSVVCTTLRFQSTRLTAVSVPIAPSVVMVPETVHPLVNFSPFRLYTTVVCADAAIETMQKNATANHNDTFIFFLHLGQGPCYMTEPDARAQPNSDLQ